MAVRAACASGRAGIVFICLEGGFHVSAACALRDGRGVSAGALVFVFAGIGRRPRGPPCVSGDPPSSTWVVPLSGRLREGRGQLDGLNVPGLPYAKAAAQRAALASPDEGHLATARLTRRYSESRSAGSAYSPASLRGWCRRLTSTSGRRRTPSTARRSFRSWSSSTAAASSSAAALRRSSREARWRIRGRVVTLNYRLGALRFLVANCHASGAIKGNMGLYDQQMAMQWVVDNIAPLRRRPHKDHFVRRERGAISVACTRWWCRRATAVCGRPHGEQPLGTLRHADTAMTAGDEFLDDLCDTGRPRTPDRAAEVPDQGAIPRMGVGLAWCRPTRS